MIAAARQRHWDAGHHCSGFVLGADASTQRSNDDGEPGGTAGVPILAAIAQAGVSDVVVVVTRWFGGTLLGTGGLVRAYGGAARAALIRAGRRPRQCARRLEVAVGHAEAGRLESELRAAGVRLIDTRYGAKEVVMVLQVPVGQTERLAADLAARTGGRAQVTLGGLSWIET